MEERLKKGGSKASSGLSVPKINAHHLFKRPPTRSEVNRKKRMERRCRRRMEKQQLKEDLGGQYQLDTDTDDDLAAKDEEIFRLRYQLDAQAVENAQLHSLLCCRHLKCDSVDRLVQCYKSVHPDEKHRSRTAIVEDVLLDYLAPYEDLVDIEPPLPHRTDR